MNELNQQETDKDKWNFATVFLETKGEVKREWRQNSSNFFQLVRSVQKGSEDNIHDVMFNR